MRHIDKSTVFRLSVAGAVLLAGVVAYPLARERWLERQSGSIQAREFVAADDLDQQAIVRALLVRERDRACPTAATCPSPLIHFDRRAATLRPIGAPGAWAAYEIRTLAPEEALRNNGDAPLPPPLDELLRRLMQRTEVNADPALPGIVYVTEPARLPALGTPRACDGPRLPMLLRISRAALQVSQGVALALVAPTYCDGSGRLRVARLQRTGKQWQVVE